MAQDFDHSAWDRVLKKYVTEDGRVDYAALKENRAELDGYIAQLAARSPESHPQDFPTPAAQLAYWINAYNALMANGVLNHWPIKSVREIGVLPFAVFRAKDYTAGGKKVSLNDIEHGIIRKQFAEPRINFALVCASLGCPKLRREAFTPDRLEEQLEDSARYFLSESRNLSVDAERNRVTLSKIFDWYGSDFEKHVRAKGISATGHPILDYAQLYADEATRDAIAALKKPRVAYSDYSWEINAVSTAGRTTEPHR
jgi:hypothetical protein